MFGESGAAACAPTVRGLLELTACGGETPPIRTRAGILRLAMTACTRNKEPMMTTVGWATYMDSIVPATQSKARVPSRIDATKPMCPTMNSASNNPLPPLTSS